MTKKIVHIDMDAFFAAVEQRDFPEYKGKPVIVGGEIASRGVVSTCSYEARKFGVHSAMSAYRAKQICPNGIFVRPRMDVYRNISDQLKKIFYEYTSLVENVSIDEAYLDVTDCKKCSGSATLIAKEIKDKIKNRLNLTASAGVSYNKFLAKIASDCRKPDGLMVILPKDGKEFVANLKVRQFHGIGKKTESKMHSLKIETGRDLLKYSEEELKNLFGKFGIYLYSAARSIDKRPIITSRVRKSIGKETTFAIDIGEREIAMPHLYNMGKKVFNITKNRSLVGKTLTIKIKYADFKLITRSKTEMHGYTDMRKITDTLEELLISTEFGKRKVRLLGVRLANFLDTPGGAGGGN